LQRELVEGPDRQTHEQIDPIGEHSKRVSERQTNFNLAAVSRALTMRPHDR
jgi:hypothetical protein